MACLNTMTRTLTLSHNTTALDLIDEAGAIAQLDYQDSLLDKDDDSDERDDDEKLTSTRKRDITRSPSPPTKRRKLELGRRTNRRGSAAFDSQRNNTVADVIVRRVLNKVRRARNISSLHALMSLPPGRARRSKHDDITACVVDLSEFVS